MATIFYPPPLYYPPFSQKWPDNTKPYLTLQETQLYTLQQLSTYDLWVECGPQHLFMWSFKHIYSSQAGTFLVYGTMSWMTQVSHFSTTELVILFNPILLSNVFMIL
jgi:hypothetical protein